MEGTGLSQYYDMLKQGEDPSIINSDEGRFNSQAKRIHYDGHDHFGWKDKVIKNCNHIKNTCAKHIIFDIYFHALPLDHDYKCHNIKTLKNDVTSMLQNKDMDAMQYLTSCYEKTKAPLLNYIIRNINEIGKRYLEDASKTLADARNSNGQISKSPEIKDVNDKEVESQIIEDTKNLEYDEFKKRLSEQTKDKVVNDISKLIINEKKAGEMTFNKPVEKKTESVLIDGMDYLQKIFWENSDIIENNQEEFLGIAIRESTLNQLDMVFRQDGRFPDEFHKKLWSGKAVLINESVKNLFISDKK